LGWGLAGALALLLIAALAGVAQGGPLDPPGPPASTQPQVEPRTPVSSLPFTITQPGSYFLTKNLTGSSGDGITVQSDDVTIDLNGFTLSGAPGTFSGISEGPFSPTRQRWTIRNGTIANWPNSAIFAQHVQNGTFADLNIAGNGINGSEALVAGGGMTVRNVKATGNFASGIVIGAVSTVADTVAASNGGDGIVVESQAVVRGCTSTFNAGYGIYLTGNQNRIESNLAAENGLKGYKAPGLRNTGLMNVASNNGTGAGADQYDINPAESQWVVVATTTSTTGAWVNLIN
jgi:hypothetical protein